MFCPLNTTFFKVLILLSAWYRDKRQMQSVCQKHRRRWSIAGGLLQLQDQHWILIIQARKDSLIYTETNQAQTQNFILQRYSLAVLSDPYTSNGRIKLIITCLKSVWWKSWHRLWLSPIMNWQILIASSTVVQWYTTHVLFRG